MGAAQYCGATQLTYGPDISIGPKFFLSYTTICLTFRASCYRIYPSTFESEKSRITAQKEYSEVDTIIYLAFLSNNSLLINLEMNN